MPGSKLPILTITNKQYWRDDGLYIYSSADGQLDVVADTTFKVAAPTIDLTSTTTLKSTNNAATSGSYAATKWKSLASSNAVGYLKWSVGSVAGYIPVFSSNCII